MEFSILLSVMLVVMMFMSFRRQKQQAQSVNEMQSNLVPGTTVVTIGGLHGVVTETTDKTVVLDCEGIYLTFERRAIARIVEKAPTHSVTVDELYPEQDVQEESIVETVDAE
ncbi:preprotein translocase subunit YajC [Carnobacteriaceae bacterium zg-ZUI252]|nr:preprotein translocase subunit YajC [Carnobacteriaceae bacterium zg-ZUI252]MBS4770140.1 preprotein translocase subunit YajC [Carnobacteriaceae bacterium zg-ZUI240]QTU82734.1 preprotein translocase subunit YajC [Carnobacteriaceae bacterium zg-C25]